ncbi:ATP-binding protein [Desulfopila aestuarii]|uniref:histidine kinase n=1 Tax=Desulfopila aestuarii DSM 18488 TaxID=1121416 RepID=A0A1M7Y5T3_9BACT|nr:ATP-binding protein [Desulfopila aestuarii]SHO47845.1 His Kinase A (phospho-acceptor) domain-containing protein [Desulfopila aestuarii DSM 18488]
MFSHSPIARRLMILTVAFSTAITVLTTASQLLFDYRKELGDLQHQLDEIKTTQINSLSHSIWTFDTQGIRIIIDSILQIRDMEFLKVYVDDQHSWSGGDRTSHNTIEMEIPIPYNYQGKQLTIGTLQVVASLDTVYSRLIRKAVIIFIGNGLKTFLVSIFILTLFQRLVTRHLIDLADHATRVAADISSGPFRLNRKKRTPSKNDELDNASAAINLMHENLQNEVRKITEAEAERVQLQEQLVQAQKMESVGRLAGGVAHDFNNMLGVILGYLELAKDDIESPQLLHTDLMEIEKAAMRSANLTRQLLAFARNQPIAPQTLNLNEVVSGMLKMLKRLIGEDINLVWKPAEELWPIYMDQSQIDQILANLCINARDAIDGTGQLLIATERVTIDENYCQNNREAIPGEYAQLIISDTGCGMDRETLDHLFEPFFTTKSVGEGTGLGMATVYGIVKQNNGFINVYSEQGQGTTVKIYLPRYCGNDEPVMKENLSSPDLQGDETILLIEDDPRVLEMAKTMLERLGYSVLTAALPNEAIELVRKHTGNINLIISDVIMPDMNGQELFTHLLTFDPELKVLFTSGYTANIIAHHGVLDADVKFIEKPYTRTTLGKKVREILDQDKG